MVVMLLLGLIGPGVASVLGNPAATIETEDFRWTRFPLKVQVDMNQWSSANYSVAIREALNSWLHSIWNYTNRFGGNLPNVDYRFYVSNVNATADYDVFITFSPDEIRPNSGIVGLTNSSWNPGSHEPYSPITINVTTYHSTVYDLFVKNVAMHEFGHALGVGHASSQSTSDGPELMYPKSIKDQVTYPSTLDVYALVQLYQGDYGDSQVQLPSDISYVMLTDGSIPPPSYIFWETLFQDLIIIAILIVALVIVLVVVATRRKPAQAPAPTVPLPPTEPPQTPETPEA